MWEPWMLELGNAHWPHLLLKMNKGPVCTRLMWTHIRKQRASHMLALGHAQPCFAILRFQFVF